MDLHPRDVARGRLEDIADFWDRKGPPQEYADLVREGRALWAEFWEVIRIARRMHRED